MLDGILAGSMPVIRRRSRDGLTSIFHSNIRKERRRGDIGYEYIVENVKKDT